MFDSYWRKRAQAAEAQLAEAKDRLVFANAALDGMKRRFDERAALISIRREGRRIFFTFARAGEIIRVDALGTWNDDVELWKKLLIDALPNANDTASTQEN